MADPTERMTKLHAMLQKEPDDTFLLYALALEHKKLNNAPEALSYLTRVVQKEPDNCAAWQQTGILHEGEGNVEAAKKAFRDGIAAAHRVGNMHALEEMTGSLNLLE